MPEENGKANAVGNNVHTDLPLTRYPEAIDNRGSNEAGGNENLNLHQNLEDYNMAEHVNALADAVMSIQRALGIAPQLHTSQKDSSGNVITDSETLLNLMKTKTVKTRLDTLEDKNFDSRYGGPEWSATSGQHLVGHTHTGETGHPQKVRLTSEVQGLLPRQNINLDYNTVGGLTGANISINATRSDSIDAVVADKLSQKEGGVIQKDLVVNGRTWNRVGRDYDAPQIAGDKESDSNASLGISTYKKSTEGHVFLHNGIGSLYYGKYVAIIRAKADELISGDLIKVSTITPQISKLPVSGKIFISYSTTNLTQQIKQVS
jgi:hypothetical protein